MTHLPEFLVAIVRIERIDRTVELSALYLQWHLWL